MFVMQFSSLFKIDDEKEFTKAALRVWHDLHPHRPRKKPGPRSPLKSSDVYDATAAVLEGLTPRQWKALEWKELIAQVQARVGPKQGGELYSDATIRKHVRDYIYFILYWPEIPPKLLDHRQPWMKGGPKKFAKRVAAFYRYRAIPPRTKS